jgi:late competence protein required for DNA uptake (superfamily II DNA/RNA helicase)
MGKDLITINTPHMETKFKVVYYEMFSTAGEKACQKLVNDISGKILGDKRVTGAKVGEMLEEGVAEIAKTHREVYDTEPRGEIAHQISKALKQAGYGFHFNSYQHLCEGIYMH